MRIRQGQNGCILNTVEINLSGMKMARDIRIIGTHLMNMNLSHSLETRDSDSTQRLMK